MKKLILFILAAVLVSCSQQETFNKEVKRMKKINGIDRLVGKDRIVPIPITPKILSTNMFKIVRQDESGALYFKDGLGIDIVASYVRNCYDIYISGNKILKDIKYCHELQHFLFGIGLNSEMEV